MTSRRASLPGAEELFRRTTEEPEPVSEPGPQDASTPNTAPESPMGAPLGAQVQAIEAQEETEQAPAPVTKLNLQVAKAPSVESTKKPKHEEKVTFYCTGSELTRIEATRLALRAQHHLASDRGKIVRAALAEVLEDFEMRGPNSALVKRLQQLKDQD